MLQQQTLDAEQKKLDLGASTIFLVVTDQQALASRRSRGSASRGQSGGGGREFQRALGRTLDVFKITVADAKSGRRRMIRLFPGRR